MVKLEIGGRLTRDVEVKTTSGGNEIANFSVAVSVPYKEVESAFFEFKAWAPYSQQVAGLKKGQPIYIVATPRTEKWEKEGKQHSKQVWYPVHISIPGSKQPAPRASTATAAAAETPAADPDDDNIPF